MPLAYADADPANNIVAGASRFSRGGQSAPSSRPAGTACPHSRISAPPTRTFSIRFLTAVPGPARGGGPGGRGAGPVPSGAPPELIAGSGSVWTRPEPPGGRGRGALPPYPDGCAANRAPGDQRIRNDRQPHEAALHDDREIRLERAGHQVAHRVRRRSHARRSAASPEPAFRRCATASSSPSRVSCSAPGVTIKSARGTARTANSCGRRASAATSSGSPAMYEMDGRTYLLVPAAGTPPTGRGGGPVPTPAGVTNGLGRVFPAAEIARR